MSKRKTLYTDPNAKWNIIGKLVEEKGTDTEKIAWALCRGEAAEWRLGISTTSIDEIRSKLKAKIRRDKAKMKENIGNVQAD